MHRVCTTKQGCIWWYFNVTVETPTLTTYQVSYKSVLKRRRHLHQLHFKQFICCCQQILHSGLQVVKAVLCCKDTFKKIKLFLPLNPPFHLIVPSFSNCWIKSASFFRRISRLSSCLFSVPPWSFVRRLGISSSQLNFFNKI